MITLLLAAGVLTIPLASCANSPAPRTIYITPPIPAPVFPDPAPAEYDDTTGRVSMPLEYWLQIVRYKAAIDAVFKTLSELPQP